MWMCCILFAIHKGSVTSWFSFVAMGICAFAYIFTNNQTKRN